MNFSPNTEFIQGISNKNLSPNTQIITGIPLKDMKNCGFIPIQNTTNYRNSNNISSNHRSSNNRNSNYRRSNNKVLNYESSSNNNSVKDTTNICYIGSVNIEKFDIYSQEWICKKCNQFHYYPMNIGCCKPDKNKKKNFNYLLYLYLKRSEKNKNYNYLKDYALSK